MHYQVVANCEDNNGKWTYYSEAFDSREDAEERETVVKRSYPWKEIWLTCSGENPIHYAVVMETNGDTDTLDYFDSMEDAWKFLCEQIQALHKRLKDSGVKVTEIEYSERDMIADFNDEHGYIGMWICEEREI